MAWSVSTSTIHLLYTHDLFAMSGCLAETQDSRPFPPSPPRDICYWLLAGTGGRECCHTAAHLLCNPFQRQSLDRTRISSFLHPSSRHVCFPDTSRLLANKQRVRCRVETQICFLVVYVGLKISTGIVHTDWRFLRLESWSLDRSWWGLITSVPLPHSSQLMNHYDWYLK